MKMKKMNKLLMTLCLVLITVIFISGYNIINAEDTESVIKIEDASIKNILTGTAAMDGNDNPGYDSSSANDIVRSFDTVIYPLNINLSSTDGKTYKNIKIKITGNVSNGVSDDKRIANAIFDTNYNGTIDMVNGTSTMDYSIIDAKTGAAIGRNIPLNILGATNGTALTSSFTIQVMSAVDETGATIDLSGSNVTKTIDTISVKVSSEVNLEVKIGNAFSDTKYNFDIFTNTTDNTPSSLRYKGLVVGIKPLEGRSNMLGSAYPESNVKVTLSTIIDKVDNYTGVKKSLKIGTDTRPITIFDYGYNNNKTLDNHLHDSKYNNHKESITTVRVPASNSYDYPYTSYKNIRLEYSGAINANNTGTSKMEFDFNNYRINEVAPNSSVLYPSPNPTVEYDITKFRAFASVRYLIVEPDEQLTANSSLLYTMNVDKVEYTDNGINKIQDINLKNSWTKTKNSPGNLILKTTYNKENNDGALGSDTVTYSNTGDAKATQNQKIAVQSWINIRDYNYYDVDLMQRWNPFESVYDKNVKGYFVNCPPTETGFQIIPKVLFGVSKINDYSLNTLNTNTKSSYIWYNSVEEAQAVGSISAVSSRCSIPDKSKDSFLNTEIMIRTPRVVIGGFGIENSDGTPHVTVASASVDWSDEVTPLITTAGASDGRKYTPTTYLSNSEIDKFHTPAGLWGSTLNIVPIATRIGKSSDKKSYAGADVVHWTLQPVLNTDNPISDVEVTITDLLPKGVLYEAGTSLVNGVAFEPDITNNANGTTELKWRITGINDKNIGKITFDTVFDQLKLTFNSSSVAALTNNVNISSPSDPSPLATRKSSYDFNVIKASMWGINKSVDKPYIEMRPNVQIEYTLEIYNNSGEDRNNITGLDVLPANGYLGTSINGTYKLQGLSASSSDAKVYYTTQSVEPNTDPNILEPLVLAGNNGWTEYTGGSLDVSAKAIFFRLPLLKDGSVENVKVKILPNSNKAGDFYINKVYGNSDAKSKVISNTQVTGVANRTIDGNVWYDDNYNGLMDASEDKVAGIPVSLYRVEKDKSLTLVKESLAGETLIDGDGKSLIKTNAAGYYKFSAVAAETDENVYVVGFGIKDRVADNEFNVTKMKVSGGAAERISVVDENDTKDNYILSDIETPFEFPYLKDMNSATFRIYNVNLGLIEPADLSITKKAISTDGKNTNLKDLILSKGSNVKYELEVKNNSTHSFADDVIVNDVLDDNLTYKAGTLQLVNIDGTKVTLDDSNFDGQTLSANVGKLKGEESVTLSFEVIIVNTYVGEVNNIADVEGTDPIIDTVTAESSEITVKTGEPLLSATKVLVDCNGDGTIEDGEEIEYSIYIRNTGNLPALNVNIKDLLNDDEFKGASIGQATVIKNGTTLTTTADIKAGYNALDLAIDGLIEVKFKVTMANPIPLKDGIIENQASVTADNHPNLNTTSDTIKDDNTRPKPDGDLDLVTTSQVKNAKLVGTKIVEGEDEDVYVEAGEKLKYTIYFTNIGEITSRETIITDLLEDDEFKNATIGEATAYKGNEEYKGDITKGINIKDLEVNQVVKVVFTVTTNKKKSTEGATPNLVVNQAFAKGENTTTALTTSNVSKDNPSISLDLPGENPVPTVMPKENPQLTGTKIATVKGGSKIIEPDGTIEYTLYFRNIGKVTAHDVLVVDPLSDLEFGNAKISEAVAKKDKEEYKGDITKGIQIGDLVSDQLVTIKFTVVMPSTIAVDNQTPKKLVNQANAKGSNTDIVYTTSNVNPNDPTRPKNLLEDPKPTEITLSLYKLNIPVTGNGDLKKVVYLIVSVITTLGSATIIRKRIRE